MKPSALVAMYTTIFRMFTLGGLMPAITRVRLRTSRAWPCWADGPYHHDGCSTVTAFEALLIREREEQLIAVWIVDLDHVITPPRFLARNRALGDLAAKLRYAILGQRHEQARSVLAIGILAKDDLALCAIDLADFALDIVFVPGFLEA